MNTIEEIWEKGNDKISDDNTFNKAFILKSISETSISITHKLSKVIWAGMIVSVLSIVSLIFNVFFYYSNATILSVIIALIIIEIVVFSFLLVQLKVVNNMDTTEFDLQTLLIYKIKYLNNQFKIVKHSVALMIVISTFAINLTIENSDGIFELRKILMLSVFYLFSYFVIIFLFRLTHNVYIKQLSNALFNLEENSFKSFDEELIKHKRIRKLIGIIIVGIFLIGMIFLLLKSGI